MHKDKGPMGRVKRDYEDTFGKRKSQNPYLKIDTPQIWPMKKTLPFGFEQKGRDIDWETAEEDNSLVNNHNAQVEDCDSDSGFSD